MDGKKSHRRLSQVLSLGVVLEKVRPVVGGQGMKDFGAEKEKFIGDTEFN